jgi:cyanate permease
VGEEAQASSTGRHIFSIGLSLAASLTSAAIFLASLIDRLPLVEVAASLSTALQVFFFSSAIADWIERETTTRTRNFWVVVFAVLLIAFYSYSRYFP